MQISRRSLVAPVYLSFFLFLNGIPQTTFAQSTIARQASKHAQSKSLLLDRLVREKQYPELERQLPTAKLAAIDRAYFEGILADRKHQVSQAISSLEKALPHLKSNNSLRTSTALRAIAGDYF